MRPITGIAADGCGSVREDGFNTLKNYALVHDECSGGYVKIGPKLDDAKALET